MLQELPIYHQVVPENDASHDYITSNQAFSETLSSDRVSESLEYDLNHDIVSASLDRDLNHDMTLNRGIKESPDYSSVPVGISARHIHLAQPDIDTLFGSGYSLQKYKELYQEGQFAALETLTVVGPKGVIEDVRIIGPARQKSQVEISKTDSIKLGISAPIKESGDIEGTPGCVLIGPKNVLNLKQGVIVAAAHIHMNPLEAEALEVVQGQKIKIKVQGERSITFNNVLVRIDQKTKLEMHVDTDEANAGLLKNGEYAYIMPKTIYVN